MKSHSIHRTSLIIAAVILAAASVACVKVVGDNWYGHIKFPPNVRDTASNPLD